jgi:hypothetical protein
MSVYTFERTETRPWSNDHDTRLYRRDLALAKAARLNPPITPVRNRDGHGDVAEDHSTGAWTYTWTVNDPSNLNIYALVHTPTVPPRQGVFESFGNVTCTSGPTLQPAEDGKSDRHFTDGELSKIQQVFDELRRLDV